MSIVYYPNRIYKKPEPSIDRVMAKRDISVVRGRADITSSAMDVVLSANTGWHVNAVMFTFSNATSRNYSVSVMSGRKVVTNWNDYLWFHHSNSLWQKITLSAGFYTGTQLATELQSKLNANTEFVSLGVTFTVTYNATTGIFTITPSSGTLKYIQTNNTQQLSDRDSIAGHLFGLNSDSAFGATVTSQTPVYGLNEEAAFIEETASVATEHYNDDLHILEMDQAIHLESNTAAVAINYVVQYEEIV